MKICSAEYKCFTYTEMNRTRLAQQNAPPTCIQLERWLDRTGSKAQPVSNQLQITHVSYHCNEPPNELEILQMIWIDIRGWVNLQAVIVLIGVFKKTVHWIEHFVGQQKKPLPRTQQ